MTLTLGAPPPWPLAPADGGTVRYRTPAADFAPDDNLVVHEWPEGFVLRYADGTKFYVAREGREVWATWSPSSTLADTAVYLLGPVLGFAQRLRGVLCLHASAVVVNGRAIAICGPAEAGKSTTAGAFAASGFGVLADDMTVLHNLPGGLMAMPGGDHLRVWETAERILLGKDSALPRLTPTWDKRALQLRVQGWRHHETPVPLGAVVLLGEREDSARAPHVEPVTPRDAFVAIVANSYTNYLLDARMRAEEFASVAGLVADTPVVRVTPHTDPARIGDLVRLIAGAVGA